MTHDVVIAKW